MKKIALVATLLFVVFAVGCSKYESENDTTQEVSEIKSGESSCPGGDDEDPLPTLRGTVVDTVSLDSLQGACVNLLTTSNILVTSTGTDDYGHYYFNSVADGSYKLVFAKSGYISKTIPITVASNSLTVNAELLFGP